MENNRWTDGLTAKPPKNEKLTGDGKRLGASAFLSHAPVSDLTLQRDGETEEDRGIVRDTARQVVELLENFSGKPTEEKSESDAPQPVTVGEGAKSERGLTPEQIEEAISLLKRRFDDPKNLKLCFELSWEKAEKTLRATPKALETVLKAEEAGHEPTICFSDETGFMIATCSDETPQSTRNCVYDEKAEQLRRRAYPNEQFNGNAVSQARAMGWNIQEVGLARHIATNTPSYTEKGLSWFKTDPKTRGAGAALNGDRRGVRVRVCRYIADDPDVSRGWRGSLRVNFVD